MSANQRKVAVLKTLLERVQQRAAAPRAAVKVAAVAMAASTTVEAHPVDDEPTPLVSASALSAPVPETLPVAEELTPSDEIMIVELSPSPGPTEVAELEVVEDELASEAARIEEALSSDGDDDEPSTSSSERPQAHHLEAMMAPMELDPISDRPTARITLPPDADADAVLAELAPQPVPKIEEDGPASSGPEITISSEPAEITLIPDEDELISIGEAELEASPPASRVQPPALPELPRDLTTFDLDEPAAEATELELEEVIELEPEAELELVPAEASTPAPEPVEAKEEPVLTLTEPVEAKAEPEASPTGLKEAKAEPEEAKDEPRQLVAELVQRPASQESEVALVVGKVEAFAPTTFGELLDASLEL